MRLAFYGRGGVRGRKPPPRRSRATLLVRLAGAVFAATPECGAHGKAAAGSRFGVRIGGALARRERRSSETTGARLAAISRIYFAKRPISCVVPQQSVAEPRLTFFVVA